MDTEEKLKIVDKEAKRFATVLSNLGMKHVTFCFIAKGSPQDKDYCNVFQITGEDIDFDRTFWREGEKKWKKQ